MLHFLFSLLYDRLRPIVFPFNKILKFIPDEPIEVLDIGSGYGTLCFEMKRRYKDLKITGVEIKRKRVEVSKRKSKGIKNLNFLVGDALDFSLGKKFDIVLCTDLIHHLPRKSIHNLINKIDEHLKQGGTLIFKDMDTKPFHKHLWNYLFDVLMTKDLKFNYMPKESAIGMLKKRFRVEKIVDISNTFYAHYLVILKKVVRDGGRK